MGPNRSKSIFLGLSTRIEMISVFVLNLVGYPLLCQGLYRHLTEVEDRLFSISPL